MSSSSLRQGEIYKGICVCQIHLVRKVGEVYCACYKTYWFSCWGGVDRDYGGPDLIIVIII